jgi:hypothetical protein
MVQTIDWYKKDADEIYDHFDSLKWEDAYLFLSHLLQNFPNLPLAWMDLFADVEEHLLDEEMVNEVTEFIDLYRNTFPGVYESEYQFIEMELIPHLFYLNDIEAVKKRLEIIKSNPVHGHENITTELLFKLIYHGYYTLALEYSHAVWKPLSEAEDIIGYPQHEFCNTIYLNELENCYNRIKKGESINVKQLKKEMGEYGFDEDLEIFQTVVEGLCRELDKNEIKPGSFRNTRDLLLFLNIQFMKYMKEEHNIPFMLSDRFFNILQKSDLFGQVDSEDGFFYIPYPVLSEHFDSQFDNMFHLNDTELFGKVFGLKFIYNFLHICNIVDDNYYRKMRENIHFLEHEFMVKIRESLWQMNFVFDWPQLYLKDPHQVRIFSETYRYNTDKKVEENLNNYLKIFIIPERIQFEMDIHNASKKKFESDYDSDDDYEYPAPISPIVNAGPKIGRNDPCPCGRGKKYKKCCLDKPVN